MGSTVLMLVLMGAAFYFLLIRPQQKRAKQQQEMTNALAPGARVMLASGVFGTIRHLGERQAIIEIAPGIEMTVLKQAIVKTVTSADDEFEYADDADGSEPDDTESSDFGNAAQNPFENIQPSDFNDPQPADHSETPAVTPNDDVPGENSQK
ncbi:preprotein translocase subunit YajC [Micropruina sp.]|uniref:preprotein translocase subunit YajC n=1 Tax=Micropruina sp. TaxID=2737536 RepID=UPI0039E4A160